jgi:hypothetical protein
MYKIGQKVKIKFGWFGNRQRTPFHYYDGMIGTIKTIVDCNSTTKELGWDYQVEIPGYTEGCYFPECGLSLVNQQLDFSFTE